jgi:rhodanese-related sulfurtransferase
MRQWANVILEALLVALVGGVVALVVNAVSPLGLKLQRDYFPGAASPPRTHASGSNALRAHGETNLAAAVDSEALALRLRAKGLQWIGSADVQRLFQDDRYQQHLVVFIDARSDRLYQEGHIPGAYQLDHYRAERYLAEVLPACLTAEQVIVYCAGGDCEDSEFAALTLTAAGVSPEILWIYGGGMAEWIALGHPVETGARGSGALRQELP